MRPTADDVENLEALAEMGGDLDEKSRAFIDEQWTRMNEEQWDGMSERHWAWFDRLVERWL